MKTFKQLMEKIKEPTGDLKKACWKGYTAVGMKEKNGRKVPNCVPEEVEQVDEWVVPIQPQRIIKRTKEQEIKRAESKAEKYLHKPGKNAAKSRKYWAKKVNKLHGIPEEVEQIDEAIAYSLSAANAAAEHERNRRPDGIPRGYKGKHEEPNKTKDEYMAKLKKFHKKADDAGHHYEASFIGKDKGTIHHHSKTMDSATLKKFVKEEVELDEANPNGMSDREYARHELGKGKKPEVKVGAKVTVDGGGSGVVQKIYDKELSNGQKRKFIHLKDHKGRDFHHRYYAHRVRVMEEVENLDELSKKTLGSYIKQAAGGMKGLGVSAHQVGSTNDQTHKEKMWKRALKREKGISMASDKLAKEEVTLDEMSKLSDALAKIKHDFENPPADHKDAKPAPAKKPEPKKGGGMDYYPDSHGGRRYMGDSVEMNGETIAESNEENARAKVRETHSQILKKGYKYIGSEQRSVGKDDSLVTHNYLSKDGSHIHHMQYSPYTMTGKGGPHIFHKKTKFNAKLHDHLTEQCFNYFDEASPKAGKNVVPPTAGTIGSIGGLVREEEGENKPLGKVMRANDGKKKFKVYVKNAKGNTVKVGFGDPNMEIKRDDPERRKNFRARHNCDSATDRTTPKYWSCRQWRSSAKVEA